MKRQAMTDERDCAVDKPEGASGFKRRVRKLAYGVAGLFGIFCGVLGSLWLVKGPRPLGMAFPHNRAEAFAAIAGGIAVVCWAAARLLKDMARQAE